MVSEGKGGAWAATSCTLTSDPSGMGSSPPASAGTWHVQ